MAMQASGTIAAGVRTTGQQVCVALVGLMLLCGAAGSAEITWPMVAIPQGVESFATGGEMAINGLPLRVRGVLSSKTPAEVAALFRATLGHPLVENTQRTRLVLGRALGEFYATVQLEPARNGTRGLIAVTRLGAAVGTSPAAKESGQRSLARFPAGSRLVSQTSSVDGLHRAEFLTLSNTLGVQFNVEHIKRNLDAQGYTLERATSSTGSGNTASVQSEGVGMTLFFKRHDAEAVAVIYRDGGANTAIVLNTIMELEHAR